jgi:integrase
MATGVRQRHGRECNRNGRCKCPYEAFVYSKRDRKKIRKTFPTHAAAQAWRDDAKTAVRKRTLRAPASTTVDQAAKAWLDGARKGLIRNRKGDPYKPATIRAYEIGLRLRVLPEIGSMRLSEVTRTDLQDLVDGLLASGLSESAIGVTLLPLRAIYKRALARPETGIAVNPTSDLEMPAVTGGRDRIASPDECADLLAALRPADRALWATAMYAGLRRGELMALRREDVDLAAGVIHVRRGWDAVEGEIATKSGKDRRVPIPAILRGYLDDQLQALAWTDGLVFGVAADRPFNDTTMREHTRKAWGWQLDDQGELVPSGSCELPLEPITLHECRHTFASLMIAAGVNAKALSTYMGHAGIQITLDLYGHLMPGNESEAAAQLDTYLDRAGSRAPTTQLTR